MGSATPHVPLRSIRRAVLRNGATYVPHRDSAVQLQQDQGCLLMHALIQHGSRPPVLICVLVSNECLQAKENPLKKILKRMITNKPSPDF
jgi:hypothetical protein